MFCRDCTQMWEDDFVMIYLFGDEFMTCVAIFSFSVKQNSTFNLHRQILNGQNKGRAVIKPCSSAWKTFHIRNVFSFENYYRLFSSLIITVMPKFESAVGQWYSDRILNECDLGFVCIVRASNLKQTSRVCVRVRLSWLKWALDIFYC